jgi:hypothetical protein
MHVLKEEDEARRLAKINKATRILTEEEGEDDDDDDKLGNKLQKLHAAKPKKKQDVKPKR